jgi:hypothetical protein
MSLRAQQRAPKAAAIPLILRKSKQNASFNRETASYHKTGLLARQVGVPGSELSRRLMSFSASPSETADR